FASARVRASAVKSGSALDSNLEECAFQRPFRAEATLPSICLEGCRWPVDLGREHTSVATFVATLASSKSLQRCKRSICSTLADGPGRDRTCDLGIKSPLLYQLSYRPHLLRV